MATSGHETCLLGSTQVQLFTFVTLGKQHNLSSLFIYKMAVIIILTSEG
jgi:hypothetical protein